MSVDVAEAAPPASPPRHRRGRWLGIATAVLVAAYGLAVWSTHAALSGGFVGWAGGVPGRSTGLAEPTRAERSWTKGQTAGYSEVVWTSGPGGELRFGFDLHNGGPVPVTVLGLQLRGYGLQVHDLATAGALLGPGAFSGPVPFHPVTIGPGGSVAVGLTVRIVCTPTIHRDAVLLRHRGDISWLGDATSPVVVRYRALGISGSQTLGLASPVLVVQPYRACR